MIAGLARLSAAFGLALAGLVAGAALAQSTAQQAPRPFAVRPGFENAKQSEFQRVVSPNWISYRYAWRQPDGKPERIEFALERASVERLRDAFQGYDPARQRDFAYLAAQQAASRAAPGVTLQIERKGAELAVRAKGADETAMRREMERVQAAWKQGAADYLVQNGFAQRPGNVVEVDLLRFVGEYVSVMRPLAQAFAQKTRGLDDRASVEMVLSFFQSIPYQDFEPPRGKGYRTPVGLIEVNAGDCDTKTVAFAATLRALRPEMGIALIMLDRHVLAAAELAAAQGEATLRLGRKMHLFMEPVGPALLPIGKIGEASHREIGAKRFRALAVPTS